MADHIGVSDDDLRILRYAALLHDTGHGPYSHFFEKVMRSVNGDSSSHESITKRIIKEYPSVQSIVGDDTDEVVALFEDNHRSITGQILSGNLDADKIDYLRRDAYHTGVAYGAFDLERLIHTLDVEPSDRHPYLCTIWKGIDALDNFRISRFFMHTQVYQHHVSSIAENMLRRATQVALEERAFSTDDLLEARSDFLKNYLSWNDSRFIDALIHCPSKKASELALSLDQRQLFKIGYELDVNDLSAPIRHTFSKSTDADLHDIEEEISESLRCDPIDIIVYKYRIENDLMKSSDTQVRDDKIPYYIRDKSAKLREIDDFSSLSSSEKPRAYLRVLCPPSLRSEVGSCAPTIVADKFR